MEIKRGEQQICYKHSFKINNFKSVINRQRQTEIRSELTEILPGKKITFVVKNMSEMYHWRCINYNWYTFDDDLFGGENAIDENDKFLYLELQAGEGVEPPSLAGKVEITLRDTKRFFYIGDPFNGEYLEFDANKGNLVLKPGIVREISAGEEFTTFQAPHLVPVTLSDAVGEEDALEIKFNLFTQSEEKALSDSRESFRYLSAQTTKIMKDESTADLKITCGEKETKKIFNVHKNFFCETSPVFRAAIESDMVEGQNKVPTKTTDLLWLPIRTLIHENAVIGSMQKDAMPQLKVSQISVFCRLVSPIAHYPL